MNKDKINKLLEESQTSLIDTEKDIEDVDVESNIDSIEVADIDPAGLPSEEDVVDDVNADVENTEEIDPVLNVGDIVSVVDAEETKTGVLTLDPETGVFNIVLAPVENTEDNMESEMGSDLDSEEDGLSDDDMDIINIISDDEEDLEEVEEVSIEDIQNDIEDIEIDLEDVVEDLETVLDTVDTDIIDSEEDIVDTDDVTDVEDEEILDEDINVYDNEENVEDVESTDDVIDSEEDIVDTDSVDDVENTDDELDIDKATEAGLGDLTIDNSEDSSSEVSDQELVSSIGDDSEEAEDIDDVDYSNSLEKKDDVNSLVIDLLKDDEDYDRFSESTNDELDLKESIITKKAEGKEIKKLQESVKKLQLENYKLLKINGILNLMPELTEKTKQNLAESFDKCSSIEKTKDLYKKVISTAKEYKKPKLNSLIIESNRGNSTFVASKFDDDNDQAMTADQKRINFLMGMKDLDDEYYTM